MSRALAKLRKQEYLEAFDVFCTQLAGALTLPPVLAREKPLLSSDEIKDTRIKMMLASYYKYGPVSMNYLQNCLMLPLQDTVARIKKYEKTHNVEFLLDAVNYLMLAYWQYATTPLAFDATDAMQYTVALRTAVECNRRISDQVMFLLSEYTDTDDLRWIGVIAVLLLREVQYPRYTDAFYLYTHETDCPTAGTYVNELEKYANLHTLDLTSLGGFC